MPKLKDFYKAVNESSGVQGNSNSEPESGYVAPNKKRKLKNDIWMKKVVTQLDFPKADNPFGVGTQYRSRKDKIINPDLYIEPITSDNYTTDGDTGEDFVQNPVTQAILLDYHDLQEKSFLAGKHDIKETLKVVESMFKKYGVKPKIKFVGKLDKSAYAIYDWMKNIMYINKSVNKTVKDFLMTVLHELYHAVQAKREGGGKKFEEKYEMEQNMIAQGYLKGKHDPYSDNKYEVEAERFAVKNWKYWEKRLDAHLKMRTNRHKGKHYKGK